MGSLIATAALPPLAWLTDRPAPILTGTTVAAVLILQRHRANVVRLRSGTEPKLRRVPECNA
jgi:glycerol-3-phosphate acyltransferase PlsY